MLTGCNIITSKHLSIIDADLAQKILDKCSEAERKLGKRINYRDANQVVIRKYARQMIAGEWESAKVTGGCITFDADGILINGNHRLRAVILASKTVPDIAIEFYLITGFTNSHTIDTNAGRTYAYILRERGEKYYVQLASVVKMYDAYLDNNQIPFDLSGSSTKSHVRFDRILSEHPNLRTSIKRVLSKKCVLAISGSLLGTFHYIFSAINPTLADEFVDTFTGYNDKATQNHPVVRLHNMLMVKKHKNIMYSTIGVATFCILAWNRMYTGDYGKSKYVLNSSTGRQANIPKIAGAVIL